MRDHPHDGGPDGSGDEASAIAIHLDALLAERHMTLTELSDRVGVSTRQPVRTEERPGQGHPLQHSRRAVPRPRLQPGDLLRYQVDQAAAGSSG
jgi:hypothetical protein